jgi:hypothetical protein
MFGGPPDAENSPFENPMLGGRPLLVIPPRKERFDQALKLALCPTFGWKTFIFQLILLKTILLLAMEITAWAKHCQAKPVLMGLDNYITWLFGAVDASRMKHNF